jgi:uncharacterized protein (DUF2249 family)
MDITPKSRIAEVIEAYPELKDKIIELAPPFKKLQNPFLMKTIARVTSLSQAAKVGDIDLMHFVNTLRESVGQASLNIDASAKESDEPPLWFKTGTIVKTIDARPMLEEGEHPVGLVLQEVEHLTEGDILELITPFVPAPLIDKVVAKGFASWTLERSKEEFKNYFTQLSS